MSADKPFLKVYRVGYKSRRDRGAIRASWVWWAGPAVERNDTRGDTYRVKERINELESRLAYVTRQRDHLLGDLSWEEARAGNPMDEVQGDPDHPEAFIRYITYSRPKSEVWDWYVAGDDGEVSDESEVEFKSRPECIADALAHGYHVRTVCEGDE